MDEKSTHYTVLARRFRPQAFDEVIGQEHVARGLQNAISSGRVAHAYLFTGARGVGKTSMARILAKTLNCPGTIDGRPCNECDVCGGVAAGQDVDVLEMDGASNRGIDAIRDLRRNVGVKSMRSRYKIYIIDEVHQLTSEAFNALLKTLEEPPENVKFIFCTTEPTKLPETILSRCQRFDFGLIELDQIVGRLQTIATAEGVSVDRDAVELVARRAAGSMRDSQSLLDQLLALGQQQIGADDVHRLLGTAPDEQLLGVVEPLVGRRPAEAMAAFEAALASGVRLEELIGQLIECCRDLMVRAAGANDVAARSVGPDSSDRLSELADSWGSETAIAALQVLAETVSRLRWTRQSRALADLAVIRIATLENLQGVGQWLDLLRNPSPGPATGEKKTPDPLPLTEVIVADNPVAAPVVPEPKGRNAADPGEKDQLSGSLETPRDVNASADQPTGDCSAQEAAISRKGGERQVWDRVVGSISDLLRDHIECVNRVAISGPNRLDLFFPSGYDFQKQFCQRPEVMHRLQQLWQNETGDVVQMRLVLEEPDPAVEEDVAARAPAEIPELGALVEEAQDVFGATIERVVPVNRAGSDDQS